ncbi:MAG: carbonic anhydrase [Prochlorococcaceae cyanobacterium]
MEAATSSHQPVHPIPCPCCLSRRQVLGRLAAAALTAGAGLLLPLPAGAEDPEVPVLDARALVLSCIDFRFVEQLHAFLARQQLSGAVDWVALAGASLALTGFPHRADARAFWDQLQLSSSLHHIREVILLDHQDCGAYAAIHPEPFADPEAEQAFHARTLRRAREQILSRDPQLTVRLYYALLDGAVVPIPG